MQHFCVASFSSCLVYFKLYSTNCSIKEFRWGIFVFFWYDAMQSSKRIQMFHSILLLPPSGTYVTVCPDNGDNKFLCNSSVIAHYTASNPTISKSTQSHTHTLKFTVALCSYTEQIRFICSMYNQKNPKKRFFLNHKKNRFVLYKNRMALGST